jgi:hypothetical protein
VSSEARTRPHERSGTLHYNEVGECRNGGVELTVMCWRGGEWSMTVLRVQGSSISFSLALLTTPSLPPIHSMLWTNLQWPDSWESLNMLKYIVVDECVKCRI